MARAAAAELPEARAAPVALVSAGPAVLVGLVLAGLAAWAAAEMRIALWLIGAMVVASCSEDRPNGSPCIKDVDCESGYCRSSTCVQPPVNTPATTATVSASTAATGGAAGNAAGGAGGSMGGNGGMGGAPGGGGSGGSGG